MMEMTVGITPGMKNSITPGKEKSKGTIDRISDLPMDVLAHILSFLSITEAVHTCILSKRWRYIWSYVPVLKFNFNNCWILGPKASKYEEIHEECEVKALFVKGVMQNREEHLDTFKLHWYCIRSYCAPQPITESIIHAIKFKPRVYSVSFCGHNILNFDVDPIFTCSSLEDLTLKLLGRVKAPDSINLPRVKRLKISFQKIDDDFINKIFLGCPVIEEMSLSHSHLYVSRISSNQLKKLIIKNCYLDYRHWLEISTPSLLYFELAYSSRLGNISSRKLPSLTHACIDLILPWGKDNADNVFANDFNVLNFISNVTTLDLRTRKRVFSVLQEKMKSDSSNHPSFANLKSLRVEWRMYYHGFDLIAFFLGHSPNLQKLIIELNDYSKSVTKEGSSVEEPKDVLFQREYLEAVKIVKGNMEESDKIANQLVKSLNAHVKTIGEIIIE